jgi:fructose-1,6-bisphosphatase II
MRRVLGDAPWRGVVVIGEGEKDDAPMLFTGERVGAGAGPSFDIAVDPLECTTYCAAGVPGSLATIAAAAPGAMFSPGPAFYMDKLVVSHAAREAIDIADAPEANLARVAEALGRPLESLRVVVLEKPRHDQLVERLRNLGVVVSTPAEGDVAGSLEVLLPDGPADVLMGIGGTPEGVMTACAARALGGGMQARLAPQRDDEAAAVRAAGIEVDRVLGVDDLVSGEAVFVATGVTGGAMLRSPQVSEGLASTESLVIADGLVSHVVAHEVAHGPVHADATVEADATVNQIEEEVPDGRARR